MFICKCIKKCMYILRITYTNMYLLIHTHQKKTYIRFGLRVDHIFCGKRSKGWLEGVADESSIWRPDSNSLATRDHPVPKSLSCQRRPRRAAYLP